MLCVCISVLCVCISVLCVCISVLCEAEGCRYHPFMLHILTAKNTVPYTCVVVHNVCVHALSLLFVFVARDALSLVLRGGCGIQMRPLSQASEASRAVAARSFDTGKLCFSTVISSLVALGLQLWRKQSVMYIVLVSTCLHTLHLSTTVAVIHSTFPLQYTSYTPPLHCSIRHTLHLSTAVYVIHSTSPLQYTSYTPPLHYIIRLEKGDVHGSINFHCVHIIQSHVQIFHGD